MFDGVSDEISLVFLENCNDAILSQLFDNIVEHHQVLQMITSVMRRRHRRERAFDINHSIVPHVPRIIQLFRDHLNTRISRYFVNQQHPIGDMNVGRVCRLWEDRTLFPNLRTIIINCRRTGFHVTNVSRVTELAVESATIEEVFFDCHLMYDVQPYTYADMIFRPFVSTAVTLEKRLTFFYRDYTTEHDQIAIFEQLNSQQTFVQFTPITDQLDSIDQ